MAAWPEKEIEAKGKTGNIRKGPGSGQNLMNFVLWEVGFEILLGLQGRDIIIKDMDLGVMGIGKAL